MKKLLKTTPYSIGDYNMTSQNESSFLDIGAGFGKPVFHAAMQTACISVGVEIVPARVAFCAD